MYLTLSKIKNINQNVSDALHQVIPMITRSTQKKEDPRKDPPRKLLISNSIISLIELEL